jgi:hypothetical protein
MVDPYKLRQPTRKRSERERDTASTEAISYSEGVCANHSFQVMKSQPQSIIIDHQITAAVAPYCALLHYDYSIGWLTGDFSPCRQIQSWNLLPQRRYNDRTLSPAPRE